VEIEVETAAAQGGAADQPSREVKLLNPILAL